MSADGSPSDKDEPEFELWEAMLEAMLDQALALTFPASDPIAIEVAMATRDFVAYRDFAVAFERGRRTADSWQGRERRRLVLENRKLEVNLESWKLSSRSQHARAVQDRALAAKKRRDTAVHAGEASGRARGKGPQYAAETEKLLQEGREPHQTAGILAKRHGVTPGAIRSAIRNAKKKNDG